MAESKRIVSIVTLLILFYVTPYVYHNTDLLKNNLKVSEKKDRQPAYTPTQLWNKHLKEKRLKKMKGVTKFDNPDKFLEFEKLIRTREGRSKPDYLPNYRRKALEKARSSMASKRTGAVTWNERGPGNVPGRTRGFLLMPNDPSQNTWISGSVGGGIWKSTDGGHNWVNKTPDLPNLATTTLAFSNANPDIIYAGTGETFAGASSGSNGINGDGIFKSTNGGETWNALESTIDNPDFGNVNRVIVDPQNPNIVLAATSNGLFNATFSNQRFGIFRSDDGGMTWTEVFDGAAEIQQLIADPTNFNIIYGTVFGIGVIKSTDAGLNWSLSNDGMAPNGRVELAISPQDPSRIFGSAQGTLTSEGNSDLYMSTDAGVSWNAVRGKDGANPDFLGGQGNYDNIIMVHPFNQDIVYLGGVNLWKMEIVEGEETSDPTVKSVDTTNTGSFLDFVRFDGAEFFGSQLDTGNASVEDFVSIEIRFGPGRGQKAHRFTVGMQGAGVPPDGFTFQDYVDIPFEVWDIDNDMQLMVSFRDQQQDGMFNLIELNTTGDGADDSREYIYVHAVPYNPVEPDSLIGMNGGENLGQEHRQMYFIWPVLAEDGVWQPNNLPQSSISILWEEFVFKLRESQIISDAFDQFDGPNQFPQTPGATSQLGLHPDHHNLVPIITSQTDSTFRIISANDGGIYISNSDTLPGVSDSSWFFAGNGYNTSQFYGMDKKPGLNEYIGGMQDNGTWRSPENVQASASTNYIRQIPGDGFEVIWNKQDPAKIIGSSQFNGIFRSVDGGETYSFAVNGLDDVGAGESPFITKIANSKERPNVLFAVGQTGVWKSEDFGENWDTIPIEEAWILTSTLDVEVSLANPDIVWAGSGMISGVTNENRLHVSIDGGETFSTTRNYIKEPLGFITGMTTHPVEDSTAFALFSFAGAPKILRTTNLGVRWVDITGFDTGTESTNGFPDVATYSLLVLPNQPQTLWAGTEIGIFESNDNGQSWHILDTNLPATTIWDLRVVDNQVLAATHGRGIWTTVLEDFIVPPNLLSVSLNPTGEVLVKTSFISGFDSTQILVNEEVIGSLPATQPGQFEVELTLNQEGEKVIQFMGFSEGDIFPSNIRNINFVLLDSPVERYSNDFNTPSEDFFGEGFSIRILSGFEDRAIHSIHPYENKENITFQLRKPVIIAQQNALFRYDDVAIVEPGTAGSEFGEINFFDFVVVEGSTDGISWQPLENGYDARFDTAWVTAFEDSLSGSDDLFRTHEIDLLETFNPGDTVLFRFRLFSDDLTTGWGWAIDNIFIQEDIPVGFEEDVESGTLALRLFPNPVNASATFEFFLPTAGQVNIKVYTPIGHIIEDADLGFRPRGSGFFQWEREALSAGIYLVSIQSKQQIRTVRMLLN